jgi:hypothetical protein
LRDDEASVLRRILSFLYLISLPVIAAAQTSQSGNWSANSTSGALLRGSWTAVPDPTGATVVGTWTLINADGVKVAEGRWSAAKAPTGWSGAWRAKASGQAGEYSGTWTSTVDLKDGRFSDLFEKAVETVVSGTWRLGEKSGAWSIRAAARPRPI